MFTVHYTSVINDVSNSEYKGNNSTFIETFFLSITWQVRNFVINKLMNSLDVYLLTSAEYVLLKHLIRKYLYSSNFAIFNRVYILWKSYQWNSQDNCLFHMLWIARDELQQTDISITFSEILCLVHVKICISVDVAY
jgi:hypothetical protein